RAARAADPMRQVMNLRQGAAVSVTLAGVETCQPFAHLRQVQRGARDELALELVHARQHGAHVGLAIVHRASHSALTCLPSAMGSKGLAITPSGDGSRKRPISLVRALAVMKMTGMHASSGSARIRFSNVGPSMPGIMTSSTTRSGCSTRIFTNARSPPSLVTTLRSPSRLSD